MPQTASRPAGTTRGARLLKAFSERGCRLLGSRFPVLGGAMSWVSERNLVSAFSRAGGFGVLACGSMNGEALDTEIAATRAMTPQPFGVNIVVLHPELGELVEVCLGRNVSHIVLAGGIPPADLMRKIRRHGTLPIAFASSLPVARKLLRSGAEALIIEGSEAGGHMGAVSLSVLLQEILPDIGDVPVLAAGGIGRGEWVSALLGMGVAGVQIGTRLVCARESIAHPNFKNAFIRAQARNAVPGIQLDQRLPVIPVRALRNRALEAFGNLQLSLAGQLDRNEVTQHQALVTLERFWVGALRRAVIQGDTETGSMMAGQSVGMVRQQQTAAEILDEIMTQTAAALEKQALRIEAAESGEIPPAAAPGAPESHGTGDGP